MATKRGSGITVYMSYLRRLLPRPIKRLARGLLGSKPLLFVRLVKAYLFDLRRYARYSGTINMRFRQNEEAWLIMAYHRIEKALALKNPRPGFGKANVRDMLQKLELYYKRYGVDDTVEICMSVLQLYFEFNRYHDAEIRELETRYNELRDMILAGGSIQQRNIGGVIPIRREDVLRAAIVDFEVFSRSRRSIRQFAPDPVELDVIKKAISIAQSTPSVCNRQTWRTHVFLDKEQIKEILKYQNGNRGFGEDAAAILIVTASLPYFIGVGERNQAFIDGGMYAMTLVYALHSLGLGTCCLNLSVSPSVDTRLHEVAKIPCDEVLIMMIAVGHLPEEFVVASSPRRPLSDVVTVH